MCDGFLHANTLSAGLSRALLATLSQAMCRDVLLFYFSLSRDPVMLATYKLNLLSYACSCIVYLSVQHKMTIKSSRLSAVWNDAQVPCKMHANTFNGVNCSIFGKVSGSLIWGKSCIH